MAVTLAETIKRHLGWCPDAHMTRAKGSDGAGHTFRSGNPSAKSPGPSGIDGSGRPGGGSYEQTQWGSVIIGSVTAAIILILGSMFLFGIVWVAIAVLGIMIVVLAICSTLTVSLDNDALRIRFGPVGLIRKSWPLAEIASVITVTNPWYYGWGIRWTPRGPLYNVSGYGAVEVLLLSGKTFRIGTGEPDALKLAIEQALHDRNTA